MNRKFELLIKSLKSGVFAVIRSMEQLWRGMKLSAEEVAQRRRNRLDKGEENFLWCWQHRGFW